MNVKHSLHGTGATCDKIVHYDDWKFAYLYIAVKSTFRSDPPMQITFRALCTPYFCAFNSFLRMKNIVTLELQTGNYAKSPEMRVYSASYLFRSEGILSIYSLCAVFIQEELEIPSLFLSRIIVQFLHTLYHTISTHFLQFVKTNSDIEDGSIAIFRKKSRFYFTCVIFRLLLKPILGKPSITVSHKSN